MHSDNGGVGTPTDQAIESQMNIVANAEWQKPGARIRAIRARSTMVRARRVATINLARAAIVEQIDHLAASSSILAPVVSRTRSGSSGASVGRVHPGQALELAVTCARVQALGIALFAFFQRGGDCTSMNGKFGGVIEGACGFAVRL